MGEVDDYLAERAEPRRAQLQHIYDIAEQLVREHGGEVTQGLSYGMAALLYRGKGLISALETAKHIGVYPYSSHAVTAVVEQFGAGDHAKGALRYPYAAPVPDAQIETAVRFRIAEIDAKLDAPRR